MGAKVNSVSQNLKDQGVQFDPLKRNEGVVCPPPRLDWGGARYFPLFWCFLCPFTSEYRIYCCAPTMRDSRLPTARVRKAGCVRACAREFWGKV